MAGCCWRARVGALVALSLGIYGNVHDPATDLSITLGFKDTITMKVWLASLAVLFAVVQLGSALWMYGKLPLGAAPGVAGLAAPDLGPARVPAQPAGRLPLPLPAGVPGHVDPGADPLAAGLRVLRRVRREGGHRPLARAAGDRAAAGGRRAVHAARRGVADERAGGSSRTTGSRRPSRARADRPHPRPADVAGRGLRRARAARGSDAHRRREGGRRHGERTRRGGRGARRARRSSPPPAAAAVTRSPRRARPVRPARTSTTRSRARTRSRRS